MARFAPPRCTPWLGLVALLVACAFPSESERERLDELERKLEEDPRSVHARDVEGQTALQLAVVDNFMYVTRNLLEHGADPAAADAQGRAGLHWAVSWDRTPGLDFVRLMLREGVSPDGADHAGWTPLHHACFLGKARAARLLLEAGADVERVEARGARCLHLCAAPGGHVEVATLLVAHGVELEARDAAGMTALQRASLHGSTPVVRALLDAGAEPNAVLPDGRAALHLAASMGHVATVRSLLEGGANPETRDERGATALEQALREPAVHYRAATAAERAADGQTTIAEPVDTGEVVALLRAQASGALAR